MQRSAADSKQSLEQNSNAKLETVACKYCGGYSNCSVTGQFSTPYIIIVHCGKMSWSRYVCTVKFVAR